MIPSENGGLSRMGRWAKGYASVMRIPVFPLGDRAKVPRAKSHGHLDATTDLFTIERWWTAFPNANIGARCIRFFVYDVDPRNDGDETHRENIAKHGAFPDTLQDTTARGGQQYFFEMPDQFEILGCTGLFPGIDIKGANGYVVLPPSQTIHGEYRWDGLANPQDQPILPAPAWLLEAILERQRAEPPVAGDSKASDTSELAAMVSKAMPGEGHRHDVFLAIAGFLARHRCPEAEAKALARAVYKLLWKSEAQLGEADKEVQTTYARHAAGDKVTGIPTLKSAGFGKPVLNALGDWAKSRHDADVVEAAADATPEQLLEFVNSERMFHERGIQFTYGIRRVGEGIEAGVWIGGEQCMVRWQSIAEVRNFSKTCDIVAASCHIELIPSKESLLNWPHWVHALLQLARGPRLSKADALRSEVQNLVASAYRMAFQPHIAEKGQLWKSWALIKDYWPTDDPNTAFPDCVYRFRGDFHVYVPCLHAVQKLRRVQGHLAVREIEEGLRSAGFLQTRLSVEVDGVQKRLQVWVAGPDALAPYWEPEDAAPADDDVVL